MMKHPWLARKTRFPHLPQHELSEALHAIPFICDYVLPGCRQRVCRKLTDFVSEYAFPQYSFVCRPGRFGRLPNERVSYIRQPRVGGCFGTSSANRHSPRRTGSQPLRHAHRQENSMRTMTRVSAGSPFPEMTWPLVGGGNLSLSGERDRATCHFHCVRLCPTASPRSGTAARTVCLSERPCD